MTSQAYIAYYRVSTARQGRSGLGLDAQREAVRQFAAQSGGVLVGDFTEVESGKQSNRQTLQAALRACRIHHARLLIAKLDRLARNVLFVSALMESGVEFTAVDFPQANRLTIHILAAVAEHEARAISERTKAALAAARSRGTALGGYRGGSVSDAARARSIQTRRKAADEFGADIMELISAIRRDGTTGLRPIARELQQRSIPTRRGGQWTASKVKAVLERHCDTAKT